MHQLMADHQIHLTRRQLALQPVWQIDDGASDTLGKGREITAHQSQLRHFVQAQLPAPFASRLQDGLAVHGIGFTGDSLQLLRRAPGLNSPHEPAKTDQCKNKFQHGHVRQRGHDRILPHHGGGDRRAHHLGVNNDRYICSAALSPGPDRFNDFRAKQCVDPGSRKRSRQHQGRSAPHGLSHGTR